ncbi:MAG TPA: heme o synthase [bacterium]|jgi:protoheme IX farnesyltransferase
MHIRSYIELTKPRIVAMVLVTASVGFYLGGHGFHDGARLAMALIGIAMGSAGAAALNAYLEQEHDAQMARTRNRAIPSGLIHPMRALLFGTLLTITGVLLLALQVNLLTAFLVLLAAFLYVLVYTPMKRLTWLNTSVGAIPGAIPPLAGWAAATGHLEPRAWILFAVLFLWQHPHFYAIAWMYRDDYRRAGFKMLPPSDPTGARAFRHILIYCALLLIVSLQPTNMGLTGSVYVWGVGALGFGFGLFGWNLALSGAVADARRLLKASVVYLPLWLALTIVDTLP